VLPGAFSTFRWEAIKGRPLDEFLKGAKDEFGDINEIMHWANSNKYLAEDRIMWLEIVAKAGCDYILNYVPGAKCLTDPPLSLTQLIKQRRRWFNGSMFASLHVISSMCSIWRRSSSSWMRNIAFMMLYLYMVIQMLLSFVIVGSFFAVFSVFIRAVIPSEDWFGSTEPANIIEYLYLIFLFLTMLLSTSIEIQWAETGFRICSFFMGLFTILMVINSALYALDQDITSASVIFFLIFLLSYGLPLFCNWGGLKYSDFIKGVVYVIYLSPTYVNIFTIYSISNIHDVTWGSRPAIDQTKDNDVKQKKLKEVEAKKDLVYKDFRARFLVFWCICNLLVGFLIIYIFNKGDDQIIFGFAIFLVIVMLFKIIISTIHLCISKCDKKRVLKLMSSKKSTVFSEVRTY
jgi:chitin synthase